MLFPVFSTDANQLSGCVVLPHLNIHPCNVSSELKELATDVHFLLWRGSWFVPDSSEVQPLRLLALYPLLSVLHSLALGLAFNGKPRPPSEEKKMCSWNSL